MRGLPDDPEDAAITRAVIALGKSLGLKVLAEGIEQPEQADFLRGLGCDYGQGYHFGWPQPVGAICADISSPDEAGKNQPTA